MDDTAAPVCVYPVVFIRVRAGRCAGRIVFPVVERGDARAGARVVGGLGVAVGCSRSLVGPVPVPRVRRVRVVVGVVIAGVVVAGVVGGGVVWLGWRRWGW